MKTKLHKENENVPVKNTNRSEPENNTNISSNGEFRMSETSDPKITMNDNAKGLNMDGNTKEIKQNEPLVTFPEPIRYDSSFTPTSIDRVPINKSVPVKYTASDLEKETMLHIVPKGAEKQSSNDMPASIANPVISNGEGSVNVTGSTQSAPGIQYEIIAIQGKKKVVGRSNPFVVTAYPYRVFRKTGEQISGLLGFSYDLVVSADSYDDPSSPSEAFKKEDKEMESALGRTSIMEEIQTSSFGTGLFNKNNPDGFNVGSDIVQLEPALITKDKLFDNNSINIESFSSTAFAVKQKMVKESKKMFGTKESKLSQFQHIYFGEDVAGINTSDKVQIPQSYYTITHKLILVPQGNDTYEYKYQVETSSSNGAGYSENTIAEMKF